MKKRKRRGRKLLVASVGVAAVSYACGSTDSDSGSVDAGKDVPVGLDQVANLVAPDVGPADAGGDAPEDTSSPLDVVANLVAPDTGVD